MVKLPDKANLAILVLSARYRCRRELLPEGARQHWHTDPTAVGFMDMVGYTGLAST